jgi:hypothetical protein
VTLLRLTRRPAMMRMERLIKALSHFRTSNARSHSEPMECSVLMVTAHQGLENEVERASS